MLRGGRGDMWEGPSGPQYSSRGQEPLAVHSSFAPRVSVRLRWIQLISRPCLGCRYDVRTHALNREVASRHSDSHWDICLCPLKALSVRCGCWLGSRVQF